jgi:hypothetical protein
VYKDFLDAGFFGNNMHTQLRYDGMADSMSEHMFERIIFSVILKQNKLLHIITDHIFNHRMNHFCTLMNNYSNGQSNNTSLDIYREINKMPNLCIIAGHTYNDTKIRIILNNLEHFIDFSPYIILVNSSEFLDKHNEIVRQIRDTYPDVCINDEMTPEQINIYRMMNKDLKHMSDEELDQHYKSYGKNEPRKIPFMSTIYMYYLPNDVYACFSKYRYALQNVNLSKFSKVVLTNDSYFIIKPLNRFFELANTPDIDMTALVASNEITYHYSDFLRCYSASCIHRLVDFYEEHESKIHNFYDLNCIYEIPSMHVFERRNVLYDMPGDYMKNIHFDDEVLPYYLDELEYPVIKYKKVLHTYYADRSQLPRDFNPLVYRGLNIDLQQMTLDEVSAHFIQFGMREGRLYKKNQRIVMPEYLQKYLPDWIQELDKKTHI